ncbi:MAG: ABC-type dipeptide/oligopeptide/nickel transport system, permease component [Aeromicrobium sp.]|nr:ABC-type dipeptide/oligopeptide/nickel transport system, permease component [Aeromicrobium sp.]
MTALPLPARAPSRPRRPLGVLAVARSRPAVTVSALLLLVVVLAAIWPSLFTGVDPNAGHPEDTLLAPGAGHPFGTDQNGRDLFARVVHAARPSLLIGVAASSLALVVGTVMGVLSAAGGRRTDWVFTRLLDVLLSVPGLLLVLLVIAIRGPGTTTTVVAVALISIPGYARLVRGETLRLRGAAFVEAAQSLGWSHTRVVLNHVVPNALGPVLVLATIGVGSTIGIVASLSFLGLGPQPPTAEWGSMLSTSRDYFSVAWWPAVFPGLAITLTVLAVTVVGQHLQQRLEGRGHS